MQIIEGKYNGFCFGVQRAIETAQKLANEKGKAYTYGPITHNKEVIRWLNDQSVFCVESDEDVLRLQENDTIIIRSHGVSPKVFQSLIARGLYVEDVTCPFVKYAQNAAKRMYEENRIVIIAGQSDHPEIIGINGYTGNHAIILETPSYVENLPPMQRVGILAQTTFYSQRYEEILDVLRKKCLDLLVERTICSTTEDRQKEALELGASCNAIVVIGGKHSSNTQKLYSLCKSRNQNVQIVENQQDLNVEILPINGIIGVVAGASTPQWSIREVLTRMSEFDNTVQNTEESTPVAETIEVAVVDSTEENAVSTEEFVDVIESAALESDGAEQEDPVTSEGSEHASADEVTEEVANAEVSNTDESDEPELSAEESFERDVEKTMIRIRPGQVKNGTVVSIVGDDVYVNIGYKADGIIHQKELSLDPDAKASELFQVGDEVRVEIIRVNDGEGNVLLSKKKVALKEKEREAIAELEDGQHFEVAVKQAVKGGLLAEFLTARVFIPASHVAERFVENMEEFVGKKMLVKALEVDKNKKRIVASHREVVKDEAVKARKEIYSRFEPGQRVKGIVRRLTNFGAFTDIGGVDGLIHVTDLSWGRVRHPEDIVQVNQEVEVEILSVNPENERIALGYKQLQPKPWDNALERYVPGDIIEGRVDRMAPFGAFVEIEPGLFGLVHISQVATNRIEKVEDELQVGDIITVKVLDINPETKRISLSRRAVLQEARTQQILAEREQNRNRSGQNEEEHFHYTIPKVEETTFTLGDLFGQVDVADIDVTDIVEDSLMEDPE